MHKPDSISAATGPQAPGRSAANQPVVLCVQQRDGDEIKRLARALQAPLADCSCGREVIEVARTRPLACVIAPLQMTDMSAKRLIESLREVAPGLAVIVIADHPEVSEAVTVMRGGAHAVVDRKMLSTGLLLHLAPLVRSR